jgi:hypothetical protein
MYPLRATGSEPYKGYQVRALEATARDFAGMSRERAGGRASEPSDELASAAPSVERLLSPEWLAEPSGPCDERAEPAAASLTAAR